MEISEAVRISGVQGISGIGTLCALSVYGASYKWNHFEQEHVQFQLISESSGHVGNKELATRMS